MATLIAGPEAAGLKLYRVVALRAHNSRKGRRKASDRVIYVLGRDVLGVLDSVEGHGIEGRSCRMAQIQG